MELREYLAIVRAHWMGVLAFALVGALLAFAWSLSQPKVYAATSSGFVTAGGASDPGSSNLGDILAKSRVKSYVVLATDRSTAQKVIDDLDLDTTPEALVGRISATQPTDTVIITITAQGPDPRSARELADAWIKGLAERIEEIETPAGGGKPAMQLKLSEAAGLPSAPVSPKVPRNTLLGLLVGLLLGSAYAAARHQLDRKVRTSAQVEEMTGAPVVAAIPQLDGSPKSRPALVVNAPKAQSERFAAEAFRKLRTNLAFMDVDHPPRVIVVTSPQKGDGKSTVAANLATAVSMSGQPVHLIDGDLRRPRVAKTLGLDGTVGLTDVLAGRLPVAEAAQRVDGLDGLLVIPAGTRVPNPSEILASQAMRDLLRDLARDTMVIVDAPPLLPVTDGAILARIADGALIVVSTGKTIDSEVMAAMKNLEKVHARALGIILNRVSKRTSTADHYAEYGYEDYFAKDADSLGDTSDAAKPRSAAASSERAS